MYVQFVRSGDKYLMEGIMMCWEYTKILISIRQHNNFYYTRLHISTF